MLSQIFAVFIFGGMFVCIVSGKIPRHITTTAAALLTIILVFLLTMQSPQALRAALALHSLLEPGFWFSHQHGGTSSTGINWGTILFIAGMMIMVEGLEDTGFFRWLCMVLAKAVGYRTIPLFLVFVLLSALLSMFIDSITVILFLVAISIKLSQLLRFDPIPLILAEIFAANLGGASTMSGDPPNIIIGTALGYTFSDFLCHTGVIAWISMATVLPFLLFTARSMGRKGSARPEVPPPSSAIVSRHHFYRSVFVFLFTVVLLVTHGITGLSVASVGVIAGGLTLLTSYRGPKSLLSRLDWRTLLFFAGLFVTVSGLEQTGILELLAGLISRAGSGNPAVILVIILWISAIASAFVDNIPFAATMVPVIRSIAATQGMELDTLAWTLALGTDIGGSATPIGASANVVGTAIAAKHGHSIGWGRYCRTAVPATAIAMTVSMICLSLFFF